MMIRETQCGYCKHYWADERDAERAVSCDAFPAGIPIAVWDTQVDHRLPYPGDNGIRYEPDGEDFYADATNS